MHWLSVLGEGKPKRVEPYICLNMGTGTLDEALAWVEYCNGTRDTYYANLRRANGHAEPYNVKYWALGNEIWGPWQVEQASKEDYAKKAFQWAKALRLLDPSLCLILCGETGHSSWDHHVLKECVSVVDMHSIHIYTASSSHLPNVTAPLSAERAIQTAAALIDVARIENKVPPGKARTRICFDEWNVWDPERAPGEQGAERYTLSDALAVAVWLNVFVRQARYVGMANLAQTVNVISPLLTTRDSVVRQTTWWPLELFSRFMRGWTVAAHVSGGSYGGETAPEWLQGVLEDGAPWLDVSAVVDEKGWVNVAVVNISDEKDFETTVKGVGAPGKGKVEVHTVSGADVNAVNVPGKEEAVGVKGTHWDGEGGFVFPRHSMTLLRWKA